MMEELNLYKHLLSIEWPWVVKRVEMVESETTIHVYLEHEAGLGWPCQKCKRICLATEYSVDELWRDIDTLAHKTVLHAKLPRSDCPVHGRLPIAVPWAREASSPYTSRLEDLVQGWLSVAPESSVEAIIGLRVDKIDGIMQRVGRQLGLPSIGLRLTAAGLLFYAAVANRYLYFDLLRFVVFSVAVFSAIVESRWRIGHANGWKWFFITVAVVFNPIATAALDIITWKVIDLLAAGLFLLSIPRVSRYARHMFPSRKAAAKTHTIRNQPAKSSYVPRTPSLVTLDEAEELADVLALLSCASAESRARVYNPELGFAWDTVMLPAFIACTYSYLVHNSLTTNSLSVVASKLIATIREWNIEVRHFDIARYASGIRIRDEGIDFSNASGMLSLELGAHSLGVQGDRIDEIASVEMRALLELVDETSCAKTKGILASL